ncbi:hypothetical protein SRHO_G00202550 [Serrasalmus rhombeus]
MLCTLEKKEKALCGEYLLQIVHAYNCTCHEATGYSPFYQLFGQYPCLSTELLLGLTTEEELKRPKGYAEQRQRLTMLAGSRVDSQEHVGKNNEYDRSNPIARRQGWPTDNLLEGKSTSWREKIYKGVTSEVGNTNKEHQQSIAAKCRGEFRPKLTLRKQGLSKGENLMCPGVIPLQMSVKLKYLLQEILYSLNCRSSAHKNQPTRYLF